MHLSSMERGLIVSQCIALLGMAATGINMTAKNVVATMMAFAENTQNMEPNKWINLRRESKNSDFFRLSSDEAIIQVSNEENGGGTVDVSWFLWSDGGGSERQCWPWI